MRDHLLNFRDVPILHRPCKQIPHTHCVRRHGFETALWPRRLDERDLLDLDTATLTPTVDRGRIRTRERIADEIRIDRSGSHRSLDAPAGNTCGECRRLRKRRVSRWMRRASWRGRREKTGLSWRRRREEAGLWWGRRSEKAGLLRPASDSLRCCGGLHPGLLRGAFAAAARS